ncbi:hypothetical protein AcV7_009817 [Taiwanofungus camphoratus]|nr:hypothetical protein AcV7_009817 [Antrodia cinnamomea]
MRALVFLPTRFASLPVPRSDVLPHRPPPPYRFSSFPVTCPPLRPTTPRLRIQCPAGVPAAPLREFSPESSPGLSPTRLPSAHGISLPEAAHAPVPIAQSAPDRIPMI